MSSATDNSATEFMRSVRARHPRFGEAVIADARITAARRGDPADFESGWKAWARAARLALVADAFLAQVLYRAKASLQRRGIPVLPRIAHRLAMATAGLTIGDPVVVQPGIYVVHGQVVVDGITEIGPGVVLSPFVTVGLRSGDFAGPKVGRGVMLGTGAKVLGNVTVGDGATVGANAVVVSDVEAGTTVVGAPARPVQAPTP